MESLNGERICCIEEILIRRGLAEYEEVKKYATRIRRSIWKDCFCEETALFCKPTVEWGRKSMYYFYRIGFLL